MKTPQRLDWPGFAQAMEAGQKAMHLIAGQGLACNACRTAINHAYAPVTVHHLEFPDCTGSGIVFLVLIPYCPACEPQPGPGCIHLPYPEPLDLASRGALAAVAVDLEFPDPATDDIQIGLNSKFFVGGREVTSIKDLLAGKDEDDGKEE